MNSSNFLNIVGHKIKETTLIFSVKENKNSGSLPVLAQSLSPYPSPLYLALFYEQVSHQHLNQTTIINKMHDLTMIVMISQLGINEKEIIQSSPVSTKIFMFIRLRTR